MNSRNVCITNNGNEIKRVFNDNINKYKANEKKKSRTRYKQFSIMIDFLTENKGLINGKSKSTDKNQTQNILWSKLAHQLNATDGPVKTVEQWKRVLTEWKFTVRKKVKLMSNGFHSNDEPKKKLSRLEEMLYILMSDVNVKRNSVYLPDTSTESLNEITPEIDYFDDTVFKSEIIVNKNDALVNENDTIYSDIYETNLQPTKEIYNLNPEQTNNLNKSVFQCENNRPKISKKGNKLCQCINNSKIGKINSKLVEKQLSVMEDIGKNFSIFNEHIESLANSFKIIAETSKTAVELLKCSLENKTN